MHQSKLFTLLNGLKAEEIRWFQKFLKSPFYNTNEQHLKLFEYIKKYYPDLGSSKLSKEAACKKLFPKEPFNIQKVRKLMHGLTLLIEEFIVVMRLKNKPYQKKRMLVSELGERNIYELFKKGTEELIEELEALPYRDVFFHREMQVLNLEYYEHVETNKQTQGLHHLKLVVEHLNAFYLLHTQRVKYAIEEHKKIFNNDLKIASLEHTRHHLIQNPIFQLYQLLFQTLTSPNSELIYVEIETLFKNEIKRINQAHQLEIIRILINYWTSFINKGERKYSSKVFELYQFGLEHHLIVQNQQLGEVTFTNIVTCGVLENELDWVENFIKGYKDFLPKSSRENATCLSYSFLLLTKKEYQKAIDLTSNHVFSSPLHILKSRTILLRAYFEQFILNNSYYDLLITQTQSFEKFVRRNTLISSQKEELYLNFILFCRKMAHAVIENTLNISLLNKIKHTPRVLLKFWLIEKIEILLKRQKLVY